MTLYEHLLCTSCVQGAVRWRWWYRSHFTKEGVETQSWAVGPTSYSWFIPRKSGCRVHAFNHCINCRLLIGFAAEKERTLRISRRKWGVSTPGITGSLWWSIRFFFKKRSDDFGVLLLKSVLLKQSAFISRLILRAIYHVPSMSFLGYNMCQSLRWAESEDSVFFHMTSETKINS